MSRNLLYCLLALLMPVIALATTPGSEDAAAGDGQASKAGLHSWTEPSVAEAIPMLEDKLAIQLQGKSEPGMGGPVSSGSNEQAPRPDLPTPPAGCSTYVNVAHGFSIGYPQSFFVQPQEVSKLSRFTPTPVASMFFMNPTMASGALAGIEPPDPEVRVYRAEAADSLKNWLFSGGIASSAGSAGYQPYRSASVDGLKVCHSTLIAPGCSVYVLHSGRVYQLMRVRGKARL